MGEMNATALGGTSLFTIYKVKKKKKNTADGMLFNIKNSQ